jgi:RNA polymerase sigma-32 factor
LFILGLDVELYALIISAMENSLTVIPSSGKYPVVSLPSPTQFEAYAHVANSLPLLSPEAEADMIEGWISNQDKEAARQLVLSHLRLVIKSVRSHAGYGLSPGDLAQEGTVGLMKAVQRFRPEIGVRLASFAMRWIEAEIREFIFRSWRMVRLGSGGAMRKLFFSYRKTLTELRHLDPDRVAGVSAQEIAQALEVSVDQVRLVEGYFRGTDMSISPPETEDDVPMPELDTSHSLAWESSIQGPEDHAIRSIDEAHGKKAIALGWSQMTDREQKVLQARRLRSTPLGLKEVGSQLGISAERVRQIEDAAWEKLVRISRRKLEYRPQEEALHAV